MDIRICKFEERDLRYILSIWNEIIDEGECFFWTKHFSPEQCMKILRNQGVVYCAKDKDKVVGFYLLHPNFPGRGNHIANALYGVKREHRGKGIGKMLAHHCIETCRDYGYEAMQFNSVVSTNAASIALLEGLDFNRVGQIPKAFRKSNKEAVDIYIYHKEL